MLEGFGLYEWLKDFDKRFDETYTDFIALMKRIQQSIFNSANLTVSVTSAELDESIRTIPEKLHKENEKSSSEFVRLSLDQSVKSEAIQIPGGVSYASLADNIYRYNMAMNGKMPALSKLMSYQYLWNEIRVLGGAYGCGMSVGKNGNIAFYSYRDPNPSDSQQVFRKAGDFIREYVKSDAEFDNIIFSAAASLEPLIDTRKEQEQADLDYFYGITPEVKRAMKKELLEMKKEDLLLFCDVLDKIAENGFSCTVAPKTHTDTLKVDKINHV